MGNPISHWELMVSDVAKAEAFYSSVFDWEFDRSSPSYHMVKTGSDPAGGIMLKPEMAPSSGLNAYFQVDDIDATLQKASAGGASVLVPKHPIEGIGFWAMFADPDGIAIGILQRQ